MTEVIALVVVGYFLAARGWTARDATLDLSWRYTFAGVLLLVSNYAAFYLSYAIGSALVGAEQFSQVRFSSELSMGMLVAICVINPIFEELIVVAYVIQAIEKKHGVTFAIGASVFIRLLYHLYQGPAAVVAILPMGVLFAVVYWRWRALWPLVVAHGLADLIALWPSD